MENLALLKWGTEQCKNTSGSDTIRQATTVDAAHGSVASCSLSLAGAQEKERVGRRARAGTRARACTRARTRRHTCTKTRGANANQPGQPLKETPRLLRGQDRPADFGGRDSLPLITAPRRSALRVARQTALCLAHPSALCACAPVPGSLPLVWVGFMCNEAISKES